MLEFFPQHKEEEERLKKGDPKGDKKGRSFRGKPFIPANEIPDPESYQNIEERIDLKKDEENKNNKELVIPKYKTKEDVLFDLKDEYFYEKSGQRSKILKDQINRLEEEIKEEQKQEKLSNEKMSKDVKFFRSGDVAHVGPDVENMNVVEEDKINVGKVFDDVNLSKKEKFKEKEERKFERLISSGNSVKENLKTMPESKKQRGNREKIKKVLSDPKNWDEAGKKSDPMDSIE